VHSRHCDGYRDVLEGQEGIVERLVTVNGGDRNGRLDVYVLDNPDVHDPFLRGFWREATDLDVVTHPYRSAAPLPIGTPEGGQRT
jgi:hypothetical protein